MPVTSDDLGHVLQVPQRQEVLHVRVQLPRRDQQQQHHREAAEDGARHEVGREDRRVPARHDRLVAKSNDTIECTLSTSGVLMPASRMYAFS
jgi:hypothetical protein